VSAPVRLRVGRLPYLNAWRFHAAFDGPQPDWTTAPPRRLGERMRAGALDAALLASRDALELGSALRPLGDLGIACLGAVGSVLLLSRVPAARLGGRHVVLSDESRTSRALVRILLAGRLGARDVAWCDGSGAAEPDADGWLVIGDAALGAHARGSWPFALDLGAEWRAWTGLPFVYARWMVRRDVPREAARALAGGLARSLEAAGDPDPARLPPGVSPAAARAYLDRFTWRMGPAERRGLRRFERELASDAFAHEPAGRRRVGSAPR
jgi:chorismate dehydratase